MAPHKKKGKKRGKKLKLEENTALEYQKIDFPQTDKPALEDFLIKKETLNRNDIMENEDSYDYLYPSLDDPNFNIKIAKRKEFFDTRYDGHVQDVEKQAEVLCNADFELAPHQLFVRNFLSFLTPYNSLLLYHGLGTGKTCSAIGVAEEMRDYLKQMGISQRIIIVASPNVQHEFRRQLFDESKLQEINGLWNIRACTGNKYLKEINPMNMKGLPKSQIVRQIKRIINDTYLFLGYIEFANYVNKKAQVSGEFSAQKTKQLIKKRLKKYFNNRLIIIDEVHNIRITDDNKDKRVAQELLKLVKNVDSLRLLLLSATPMYNSYKEIIWLVNLMNLNDNRASIEIKDIFDNQGNFRIDAEGNEVGKSLLERKATGYISFVRGENPYTFPYRIWPSIFAISNTFQEYQYPTVQLNGKLLVQNLEHISVYLTNVGSYQQYGYSYIISYLKRLVENGEIGANRELPNFENMESFGYTLLQRPLEALNIVYPDERIDNITIDTDFDPKYLVGKAGLNRIMSYKETTNPPQRKDFEYKYHERIFSPDEIGKYSSKIKNICDSVQNSTGITLIYSQYIDGGLVPIALALEELGLVRYGTVSSLFKTPIETRQVIGTYVMITGDKALSPNNAQELKALTDINNKNGENIKVVLISQAGSEGLDFKYIRQVHIMEPWYNMNRIEQIIGRACRHCSHMALPFNERNIAIFLYGTLLADPSEEAVDLYLYRLAELKAIQMGKVSRVLKKCAIDCLLNLEQLKFTAENMNQTVSQTLYNGEIIEYPVGDKPYSATCDYMETCSYTCKPNVEITDADTVLDTYSESFILMNTDKIVQRIKDLIKERFFYRKNDIITEINVIRNYPLVQINAALDQLVGDNSEYISDKYGRLGNLINIGDIYLFQPLEIKDPDVSVYDRSVPIQFKRDKLEFILPQEVTEAVMEPGPDRPFKDNAQMLIDKMRQDYEKGTTKQIIVRGDDDWYKFASAVIDNMEAEGADKEVLAELLLDHIVSLINLGDTITILDYLFNKTDLTYFETKLKASFNILQNRNIIGFLANNAGSQKLLIFRDNKWIDAEAEDYQDLSSEIANLVVKKNKINNIVGFMANFKGSHMVFKVKIMSKLGHKGARCDQAGKPATIKLINQIVGTNKYTSHNTKKINQKQICILQEFTLRLFNYNRKDGKIWFLSPIEAILIDIEKLKPEKGL